MAKRAKAVVKEDEGDGMTDMDQMHQLIVSIVPEMWPIDSVLIDPSNARKHDRKSIDGIKGSIAKFGQVESLLVRKATSVLIAGEGRLIAMKELGFNYVGVKPLPVDATTATGLSLALNRTGELSYFDVESAATQIKGLKEDNFPIDVLGWTVPELDRMFQGLEAKPIDELKDEWKGMPEFQHDDLMPKRTIKIHFGSDEAVLNFARLIGQPILEGTTYLWYPEQEGKTYADKQWVGGDK